VQKLSSRLPRTASLPVLLACRLSVSLSLSASRPLSLLLPLPSPPLLDPRRPFASLPWSLCPLTSPCARRTARRRQSPTRAPTLTSPRSPTTPSQPVARLCVKHRCTSAESSSPPPPQRPVSSSPAPPAATTSATQQPLSPRLTAALHHAQSTPHPHPACQLPTANCQRPLFTPPSTADRISMASTAIAERP
jgi:hypothetical protein